jgi:hypothetical protein
MNLIEYGTGAISIEPGCMQGNNTNTVHCNHSDATWQSLDD